jgi:ribonuclease P protein component
VLPAANRLRSSVDFATVTRSGLRVRSGDLMVYLTNATGLTSCLPSDQTPVRAGLIVSRKVGGSVIRHQVSRRLRAQLATRIGALPAGSKLVVRALPSAAGASSRALGDQLDRAFAKLTKPAKPANRASAGIPR